MMLDEPTWHTDLPTDFMAKGACHGMDTNLFFPIKGESNKLAMEACNGRASTPGRVGRPPCEVREQCLAYVLSLPSNVGGVWGGTTQKQRRGLRYEADKQNRVTQGLPEGTPVRWRTT